MKLAIVLLLVVFLCQIADSKKTEILDQDEANSNIDSIAQAVCDITRGADKQISQFSTINRLIQYFHSIGSDHRLAACAQKSLPALEQMQLILTTGNENVCGEAKIQLIESFHRNFVSKVRKYRKEQKANNLSAPKLLRLFYIHYVSAVSATCERAATRDFENIEHDENARSEDAIAAVDQVGSIFGVIDSSRGYKDMFLLWNFVDSLPLENNSKLSHYLHQGNTRLVVQMKELDNLNVIQDRCRKNVRPFYLRSFLTVIRLADLGFYPESEQLVHLLSSSPNYSHVYTITQLCETFLRIQARPNDNLKSGQVVVLSKEESTTLNQNDSNEEELQIHNSENRVDSITSIVSDNSQQFIKKVKANVNSRVSEQSKILRRLIRRFKSESSKGNNQFTLSNGSNKEDLESILNESLPDLDSSDPLGPLDNDEDGDDENVVARKKRGFMKYVKKGLKLVAVYLVTIAYYVTWLAIYLLDTFLLTPITKIGYALNIDF